MPPELLPVCGLCGILIVACYLLSLATGNYSQVDRLWSVAPPLYVGLLAAQAGFHNRRLDAMAALTLAWGVRLTFNFARKGGYRWSGEDHRWPVLRQRLGPVRFQLLNATFIAPYQNLLLVLISLPAEEAYRHPDAPLGWADGVVALIDAIALLAETIADQQQWSFQQSKSAALARGEAPPPFLVTGLFRYSRHPNYFFEQLQWWCLYLLGTLGCGHPVNLGLAGPVLLGLLFLGSTAFTEQISGSKYPSYADYQRRTSRQWPWPPRQP